MPKIRIVIDTNIWVSMALASKVVNSQMKNVLENPNIDIFTSKEQLKELYLTLNKKKLKKYITKNVISRLFELIFSRATLAKIYSTDEICRDKNDDFLINLCIDSQSQFLLTGDLDLLVLNNYKNIYIITLSDFMNRIDV